MNETAFAFFQPITALQNTSNDPRNAALFRELSWTATQAKAAVGIADRDDLTWLAEWIRENVASVRHELSLFRTYRAIDPVELARRCFCFAIVSPQCNFEENVLATKNLMAEWDSLTDAESIKRCLTVPYKGHGAPRIVNLGPTKAARILDALPWLRSLTAEHLADQFTYQSVIAQKGIADKAASMTMALFDDRSPVFTLDTWMLRLTLALAGDDPRATISTKGPGYAITAADWMSWAEKNVPELTPFEVQWTLWDGCFGAHKQHIDILA